MVVRETKILHVAEQPKKKKKQNTVKALILLVTNWGNTKPKE